MNTMSLTPLQRYQKDLDRDDFNYDAAQEAAVLKLQNLYDRLVEQYRSEESPGFARRLKWGGKPESQKDLLKEGCIFGVVWVVVRPTSWTTFTRACRLKRKFVPIFTVSCVVFIVS